MVKVKKINLYKGLLMFFILSVVLFHLRYISFPMISESELSYWNWILKLAGKSGRIMQSTEDTMLSFGYCLPFSMLIRFGWTLTGVYKLAIAINGIILSNTFYVAGKLLKSIYRIEKDSYKLETYLFLVFLLPVFYTQAVRMGPQLVLFFLMIQILRELFELKKRQYNQYKKLFSWCILGTFFSPIFIGVVIGVYIYFFKEQLLDKKAVKSFLCFISILILMEVVEYSMILLLQKEYTIELYSGIQSLYFVIANNLKEQGILGWLFVVIGKSIYLFVNTLGLAFLGIYTLLKKERENWGRQIICSVGTSTVLLIVLTSRTGLPTDSFMSMVAIVFIIPAIECLYKKIYEKIDILRITGGVIIVACICKDIWCLKEYEVIDWSSMGIISLGRKFCNNIYQLPVLAVVTVAILFVASCFINHYYGKNKIRYIGIGICLFLISVLSVYEYSKNTIEYIQNKYDFSYEPVFKILNNTERTIYHYVSDNVYDGVEPLELLLYDKNINHFDVAEEVLVLPEEALLITKHVKEEEQVIKDSYQKIYETDQVSLWENRKYRNRGKLTDVLINEKIQLPEIKTKNQMKSLYGAKTMIPAGKYKVVVHTIISTDRKSVLGNVIVGDDSGVLALDRIYRKKDEGLNQSTSIIFNSKSNMENFRIIIDKESTVGLEIAGVTVTKIGD